jgi:hypothetical protein
MNAGLFSSDGALLVYGAILAGLVGLVTGWIRDLREHSKTRQELAGIFSGTLATEAPSEDDLHGPIIGDDPPTAGHLHFAGLDNLLRPGVLDIRNESDLLLELMYLRSRLDTYNRYAELYNLAWVFGAAPDKLQGAKIGMFMSHKDVTEASDNLRAMIERIGPRAPMPGDLPLTFFYRQKTRYRLWQRRRKMKQSSTESA